MSQVDEALARAEELLGTLNERRDELERLAAADDVDGDAAVDLIARARRARAADRGRAAPRAREPRRCVPADELRDAVETYLALACVRTRARWARRGAALLARVRRQARPARALPRRRRGERRLGRRCAAGRGGARARPHLLARPRRPAGDRRRRRAPRPTERARRFRRGRRVACRRRAPRGGAPARA